MNNNTVFLTFPTDKGKNELLNKLAEIKGIKQPQLLEKICQNYIQNSLIEIISYMESKGININEILKSND